MIALARRHHDLCFCSNCVERRPARRAEKKKQHDRVRAMVEGQDGRRGDCTNCGRAGKALADGRCARCR